MTCLHMRFVIAALVVVSAVVIVVALVVVADALVVAVSAFTVAILLSSGVESTTPCHLLPPLPGFDRLTYHLGNWRLVVIVIIIVVDRLTGLLRFAVTGIVVVHTLLLLAAGIIVVVSAAVALLRGVDVCVTAGSVVVGHVAVVVVSFRVALLFVRRLGLCWRCWWWDHPIRSLLVALVVAVGVTTSFHFSRPTRCFALIPLTVMLLLLCSVLFGFLGGFAPSSVGFLFLHLVRSLLLCLLLWLLLPLLLALGLLLWLLLFLLLLFLLWFPSSLGLLRASCFIRGRARFTILPLVHVTLRAHMLVAGRLVSDTSVGVVRHLL